MTQFVALWLVALMGICVYRVWSDSATGRYDLICLRNMILVGFVIFQLISAALTLSSGIYLPYPLGDPDTVSLYYGVLSTVFLAAFLITYRRPLKTNRLVRFFPRTRGVTSPGKLLILAFLITVGAVGLKYGVRIPLVGILATYAANAAVAAAAVVVGWYWGPRLFNPAAAMASLALLAVNAAIAVQGSSSRRDIVAVFAGFIWGVYFSRVRFMRMRTYLPTLGALGAAGLIVVASFTSVRVSGAERNRTPMQHLQAMLTGTDLARGLYALGSGQQAGGISMWIIDQYPENYDFRGPSSLRFIFELPIPRSMWPDKPNPISVQIPRMARLRGVGQDGQFNVGPGMIGQSYADFGSAAVVFYAMLLAMMIRFFDDLVWRSPGDVFVVAAVGSGIGQVLAIPRGDFSLFTFVYVFGFFATYIMMLIFAKVLRLEDNTTGAPVPHLSDPVPPASPAEWEVDASEDIPRLNYAELESVSTGSM